MHSDIQKICKIFSRQLKISEDVGRDAVINRLDEEITKQYDQLNSGLKLINSELSSEKKLDSNFFKKFDEMEKRILNTQEKVLALKHKKKEDIVRLKLMKKQLDHFKSLLNDIRRHHGRDADSFEAIS